MASSAIRLAVIGGDGIGPEVVAEALKVLIAADVTVNSTNYDLGAGRWHLTGETLPGSVLVDIRGHDAILLVASCVPNFPSREHARGHMLLSHAAPDLFFHPIPHHSYPLFLPPP